MCFKIVKDPIPTTPKPIIRREVAMIDIRYLIESLFPGQPYHVSDRVKFLCDIEDINTFLKADDTNKMGFIDEERDCDDFAFRLKGQFSVPGWSGFAIGIIWDRGHAFNFVVDANMEFWCIEPQTDDLKATDYVNLPIQFMVI